MTGSLLLNKCFTIEKNKPAFFDVALISLVSVLVIAGVSIKICTIIAFVLLCVFLLLSSHEKQIYTLLFFLSFANVFKLSPSSSSLYTYLQFIPVVTFLLSKKNLKLGLSETLLLILFLGYSFVSTILNNLDLSLPVKLLSETMLVFLVYSKPGIKISSKSLCFFFSFGVIAAGIIGLFRDQIPGLQNYISSTLVRTDNNEALYRFSGLLENPNYYSIDVIFALSLLLLLYKRKIIHWVYVPLFLLLSLLGVLTQSKSYIVTYLLLVISMLFCFRKSFASIRYNRPIILILVLMVASVFIPQFLLYLSRFITSFFEEKLDLNSVSTGRIEIWLLYLREMKNDPIIFLLGTGINSISTEVGIAQHNVFVQGLYNFGLLGSILYFSLFSILFYKTKTFKIAWFTLLLLGVRLLGANIMFYLNTFYYYLLLICVSRELKTISANKTRIQNDYY